MSILNGFLGKILGNKAERDLRQISPYIGQINQEYEKITRLSNDDLRNRTLELKEFVRNSIREEEQEIKQLKEKL